MAVIGSVGIVGVPYTFTSAKLEVRVLQFDAELGPPLVAIT